MILRSGKTPFRATPHLKIFISRSGKGQISERLFPTFQISLSVSPQKWPNEKSFIVNVMGGRISFVITHAD
jgi:hypothetical protein